jgi:hypothetical protein
MRYTDSYEAIRSVPTGRDKATYDNPDKRIPTWIGDKIVHTLVNPNQLRSHDITVPDKATTNLHVD